MYPKESRRCFVAKKGEITRTEDVFDRSLHRMRRATNTNELFDIYEENNLRLVS